MSSISEALRRVAGTPTKLRGIPICDVCGSDTLYEWFTVHDDLWARMGFRYDDATLCIGCFEKILGRRLQPDDFADAEIHERDPDLMSARLVSRMGMKKVLCNAAGEVQPGTAPEPEPTLEHLPPAADGEAWLGAEHAAERLGVELRTFIGLSRDRRINAIWHPLRVRASDLDAYLARRAANEAEALSALPETPTVTGADGELIDRLIVLMRSPPVADDFAWTSSVVLGLIKALGIVDQVNWFDPRHEPELALCQLRDWLVERTHDDDDEGPIDEGGVVSYITSEIDSIVDGWASSRPEEEVEHRRAEAESALADTEALRALLARLNHGNARRYGHMTEAEFAASLERDLREAACSLARQTWSHDSCA